MIYKPIKSHSSVATILSIVLPINSIYTKSRNFCHGKPSRSSIFDPVEGVSGLSIVCAYITLCTKYILFPIKISIIGH
jgi:hypothetical protein